MPHGHPRTVYISLGAKPGLFLLNVNGITQVQTNSRLGYLLRKSSPG
jgi:hypothetical protein